MRRLSVLLYQFSDMGHEILAREEPLAPDLQVPELAVPLRFKRPRPWLGGEDLVRLLVSRLPRFLGQIRTGALT